MSEPNEGSRYLEHPSFITVPHMAPADQTLCSLYRDALRVLLPLGNAEDYAIRDGVDAALLGCQPGDRRKLTARGHAALVQVINQWRHSAGPGGRAIPADVDMALDPFWRAIICAPTVRPASWDTEVLAAAE
jgi:hypothetical protein